MDDSSQFEMEKGKTTDERFRKHSTNQFNGSNFDEDGVECQMHKQFDEMTMMRGDSSVYGRMSTRMNGGGMHNNLASVGLPRDASNSFNSQFNFKFREK